MYAHISIHLSLSVYTYAQIYTYPTLTMAGSHHSSYTAKIAKQPSVLYSTPSPPWSRVYKYACQATPATPCDSCHPTTTANRFSGPKSLSNHVQSGMYVLTLAYMWICIYIVWCNLCINEHIYMYIYIYIESCWSR